MKKRITTKIVLIVLLIGGFSNAQTGIGTTTPVNKFQIEATTADPATTGAAANGNLRISGTSGSHVLDFGLSSSATFSWLQARSKTAYGTNYFLALNPNGGWVGIGTSAPTSILTVGKSDGTTGGEVTLNPSNSTTEGGQITFKKSITSSTYDWTIDQVGDVTAPRFRIFPGATETNGIIIKENGYVGIGIVNPTTKLYVNGDITANSVAGTSDARYKINIRPVTNALEKVNAMQGVYFNWNQKEFPQKEFGSQNELGFIAQDVEKVLPEVVTKEKNNEEYRAVKYDKVVALLVEAIKEQQKQIDVLQQKVNELTKEISKK
ncbi:MAG: hypothetical protein RLY43_511 [Bacteroidota bacterium]|jgi:hypothetical protein